MAKRKRINNREQRKKDRERKRQERLQHSLSSKPPDDLIQSAVPRGTVDRGVSDVPDNLSGQGFMGLPPFEGKPLAKVQARMERNKDELENAENLIELSDNDTVENIFKKRNETCVNENMKETYEGETVGNVVEERIDEGKHKEELNVYCVERGSSSSSLNDRGVEGNTFEIDQETSYSVSVQGSFHQGDPLFGETAGTQCVANCLAGLAYDIVKCAIIWQTSDINKVLVTGDELYTYLQHSSSITNRYLLVDELPQYFECYSKTFEFKVKLAVSSLISLSDEEPCYEDSNAFPLFEALQMVLAGTSGCFVCFGGNTLLVGRTRKGFYIFDSHSRCYRGYLSVNGKSTRILLRSVHDVYLHLVSLAVSMGFSRTVECELTGVLCSLKHFTTAEVDEETLKNSRQGVLFASQVEEAFGAFDNSMLDDLMSDQSEVIQTNDVIFMGEEVTQHDFIPLSVQKQRELCKELGLPYSLNGCEHAVSVKNMDKPSHCKEIEQDGNCFFRAISFSLTNSELS